jgi:hypothetical protein
LKKMKRSFFGVIVFICAVSGAFAQDVDLGLGGDASSLLNLPAPRGNTPARGATPAARGSNTSAVDRLARLRELLAGANLPLTREQEAALSAFLTTEIPGMRRTLQARIADLQKGKEPGATPAMDELAPEIIRLNDELLGKMAAVPALSPEQQAFLKKLYKDQVKSRGGFDAIKLTLEDAGAPFSPEQIAQIQPLFDQENQSRLQLLKDSQGQQPDKSKLEQLQRDTLAKVLRLLSPAQRAALLAK